MGSRSRWGVVAAAVMMAVARLSSGGGAAQAAPAVTPVIAPAGHELIGTTAPDWQLDDWIGSRALTLASLRGKVVLLRWFTDTDCPYCSMTAPALNRLHHDFSARGLVVIGVYHHKRPGPIDVGAVRGWVRGYGFKFPVAVDRDWRTLRSWWLDGQKRDYTSVSFLIDRQGVIRYIHPGGTLALGTADYDVARATIIAALKR